MVSSGWIEVGSLDDFKESNKKVVRIKDNLEILLIKVGNSVFAIENKCTHDDKPLSDGKIIDEKIIECIYHGARFDIETGRAMRMPAVTPVNIYKSKIEDNKIYIQIE
ncbi:MAG: Rieske (2Fe-2S) protein [Candidatus Calescibacterium sp.]|nr:Rieske (2Fe-2S) protein [Candidatus Calescibacterium sp.]MCX7972508.1 Rieske (2Fe-2S) protein [bacterium]MDW8195600.1 Rieske (2Fe-2S) protein [Candidatus Calescibacterium sp.]